MNYRALKIQKKILTINRKMIIKDNKDLKIKKLNEFQ